MVCPSNVHGLETDDDDEDSDDEDEDDGLGNAEGRFPPLGRSTGRQMPTADFHEIARDHADALGGDAEGELLPIHCAATAAYRTLTCCRLW
jgi:hypothetical protein